MILIFKTDFVKVKNLIKQVCSIKPDYILLHQLLTHYIMDKRTFLKQFSLLTLTASPFMESLSQIVKKVEHIHENDLAAEEDFWAKIRGGYRLKPDYINLIKNMN